MRKLLIIFLVWSIAFIAFSVWSANLALDRFTVMELVGQSFAAYIGYVIIPYIIFHLIVSKISKQWNKRKQKKQMEADKN